MVYLPKGLTGKWYVYRRSDDMGGAYIWRYEADWVDGLDVGGWVADWDDDAKPICDLCHDYGQWVSEESDHETCPRCKGKSADKKRKAAA